MSPIELFTKKCISRPYFQFEKDPVVLLKLLSSSSDLQKIQAGLGDKVGLCINAISFFLGGFVVGFCHSWKLSLVILSLTPLLGESGEASEHKNENNRTTKIS